MVYFTDFFSIDEETLEEYGAFNISLINDLPLFIDPFLLFGSSKEEYQQLHGSILSYLSFLKSKSAEGGISEAQIKSWYKFSEVKQTWLGFSVHGNKGSGLGNNFGNVMSRNMHIVFDDLNKETVTVTSHLEKAGLFQIGVGKDNISDFTCNLIKSFLLEYTERFAKDKLKADQVKKIMVDKVYFDYTMERWMPKEFILPFFNKDYVILTPKDILTKDDNWINSHDLKGDFDKDGYRLFYYKGKPLKREADLQVIYKLTWYSSPYDVNREVNNGRGPVDYAVSKGSKDKTLIEFKLASNKKLKMNLQNQVKVYEAASDTKQSIKVIMYFDHSELLTLKAILKELNLEDDKSIILIDAGNNKPSASNVK